jgi:hypothetical protein
VSRPSIPPLSSNRPDLPAEVSDVLAQAMVRDRYARPDAATFGRSLAHLARRMPDKVPDERLATRVKHSVAPARMSRESAVFLGQRVVAGVSCLLTLLFVLPRLSFYPEGAIAPLVIVPAFFALLWPFGGGILGLAIIAPVVFAHGAGWGVIYLILAAISMALLRCRRLEWAALIPGMMPFAVSWGLGLAVLPLTGALLRRWGALVGFLSGLVLIVAGGLGVWPNLPYTFNPSPGAPLAAAADSVSPWPVLVEMARFLDSRPELTLQLFLFTLFSLPLYGLGGAAVQGRMWGGTAYLSALFVGLVLIPILALGVPVVLSPLLVAYVPCAIIGFLSALLISLESGGTL